jgi:hypothetical protein
VTSAHTALIAATAAHLGFQATVTAVVYPALARTPPAQWATAHHAHSRAITPVVAVVYVSLLAAGGWALWSGPGAATGIAVARLITAVAAAPAHGRLAGGHDPGRIRRLLRVDRLRAASAAVALIAALTAGWLG